MLSLRRSERLCEIRKEESPNKNVKKEEKKEGKEREETCSTNKKRKRKDIKPNKKDKEVKGTKENYIKKKAAKSEDSETKVLVLSICKIYYY